MIIINAIAKFAFLLRNNAIYSVKCSVLIRSFPQNTINFQTFLVHHIPLWGGGGGGRNNNRGGGGEVAL